jgi:pyruvate, orthophosphate dikinase
MQIVRIGDGSAEPACVDIVGAKAANLARMARLGLSVPPAFVLPIELCATVVRADSGAKQILADSLTEGIEFLEHATDRAFGERRRPLLVSARSSAARSMPGMLDTVLDVGCTPAAVRGLVRMTGNPGFANDCRCRFLESYGAVVLGIDPAAFAARRSELAAAEGVQSDQPLDCEALERLATSYERLIEREDDVLAEDPMEQLTAAAEAVYRSWTSDRARTYRRLEHLEDLRGTAVTVQAMVFGNSGGLSGAGVAFSRDPSTGAREPVIDVLFGSQGEDVVSGRRNPETEAAIIRSLPAVAAQLRQALMRLEQEFGDVQDIEFTIENGKLWLLQTRSTKRTPQAAVRFAIDLVKEGRITPAEALCRLKGVDLCGLVSQRLVGAGTPIACGTGASAGIAVGRAAFDSDGAARAATGGDPVILVRPSANTGDIGGFATSAGIVTAVGGRTAHAALVARQMGRPCIVGCSALSLDPARRRAWFAGTAVDEGDWLSMDGEAGTVYLGRGQITAERPEAVLAEVRRWQAEVIENHN